jgi:hypothetical protein
MNFAPKIILMALLISAEGRADDVCLKWFQDSKIDPQSKSCIIKCDLIPKDMGTFDCANNCEKFCKSKKCLPDPYWKNKIKNEMPKNWGDSSEKTSSWSASEADQLQTILNLLPEELKTLPIEGIYRMKTSGDKINPGATSEDGSSIAIYDRAFDNPFWSLSSVITHEIGHSFFQSLTAQDREDYSKALGWHIIDQTYIRGGDFVNSRAKDDPKEDFAENFSFYLLSPEELKAKVPKANDWIIKKLKRSLKLKDGCGK